MGLAACGSDLRLHHNATNTEEEPYKGAPLFTNTHKSTGYLYTQVQPHRYTMTQLYIGGPQPPLVSGIISSDATIIPLPPPTSYRNMMVDRSLF